MITRELRRFAIIGTLTVVIDFIIYNIILYLTSNHIYAKGIGFTIGTIFSYKYNKIWTFSIKRSKPYSALKYYCVYIIGLSLNVWIYRIAIVSVLEETIDRNYIAFIMATAVSALSNFLLIKYIVFRKKESNEKH